MDANTFFTHLHQLQQQRLRLAHIPLIHPPAKTLSNRRRSLEEPRTPQSVSMLPPPVVSMQYDDRAVGGRKMTVEFVSRVGAGFGRRLS